MTARSAQRITVLEHVLIWTMFVATHGWLAYANLVVRPGTFADVTGVYRFWFHQAGQGNIVGIDESWVYPLLAWLPISIAGVAGTELYGVVWLLMITVLDAIAIILLLRMANGMTLAFVYTCLQFLIGPVSVGRLDTVTVAIVTIAIAAIWEGRSGLAATLLTAGAWIKVWPGVFFLALLIVRAKAWRRILLAGAAVSAAVLAVGLALGGGSHVFSFVSQQGSRGLQAESVFATPYLWMVPSGGAEVEFDRDILTYQVYGPGVEQLASVATPLLVLAVVAISLLAILALRRGAGQRGVFVLSTYALVLALIVFNKVGSPQFFTWMIPVAILLAVYNFRRHTLELLLIAIAAFLTQLIYPWEYGAVLGAEPIGLAMITGRNAIQVGLLAAAVVALIRMPAAGEEPQRLPGARSETRRDRTVNAADTVQSRSPSSTAPE